MIHSSISKCTFQFYLILLIFTMGHPIISWAQSHIISSTPALDDENFENPTVVLPIPSSGPAQASFTCTYDGEDAASYIWKKNGEEISTSASTGTIDFGTSFQKYTISCTVKNAEDTVCAQSSIDVIVCQRTFEIEVVAYIDAEWIPAPVGSTYIFAGGTKARQTLNIIPFKRVSSNGYSGYTGYPCSSTEFHKASSLDSNNNITAAAWADTTLNDGHMKVNTGNATANAHGTPTKLNQSDYVVTIRLRASAKNPLVWNPIAPMIDWDLKIKLDATDPLDPKIEILGYNAGNKGHDNYPSYSIKVEGKQFHHHSEAGYDAWDLYGNATDAEVNVPLQPIND